MIVDEGSAYLAVIPARGGSKGIPRKNLQPVGGRPLLAWSIDHVRRAKRPMRLVVSTDDSEIAEVAVANGAEVPCLRPRELATDEAPTEPAVIHAVQSLGDMDVDHVVLLQATSPIRDPGTLDAAIAAYEQSGAVSLLSVVDVPPWLWFGGKEAPTPMYDPDKRPRRQDVPPQGRTYRETGSIYVVSVDHLFKTGNRLGPRPCIFVTAPHEGLDIDDEFDLAVADSWLRRANAH